MSKAIELADKLELMERSGLWYESKDAAAELRRLDAETVRLAAQLAEEKLRADRMTEQHRMQAEICAKVQEELAAIRALEPVAFRISYPNEPDLGFWFAEGIGGQGCLTEPLYALPEQK